MSESVREGGRRRQVLSYRYMSIIPKPATTHTLNAHGRLFKRHNLSTHHWERQLPAGTLQGRGGMAPVGMVGERG